jgi:hypothetical protein
MTDVHDPVAEAEAARILAEEKMAYAQIARDNALAMRDEAQERLKVQRAASGRVVSGLRELVLSLLAYAPPDVAAKKKAEMEEILSTGRKS